MIVLGVNQILSALADETRRNILMLLRKGKISSGEIAENLEMTPQALSYHLKKLGNRILVWKHNRIFESKKQLTYIYNNPIVLLILTHRL